MTDDIRPAAESPVDLLVIGGLTVDLLDGREAAGGAARYAVEGALAAGLRVALRTVSGDEGPVQAVLAAFPAGLSVARQVAAHSIRFEHHGVHDHRRLRLATPTDLIEGNGATNAVPAAAVLFAPVAGEVGVSTLAGVAAPIRAAGLQGWLRAADDEGWVQPRRLSDLEPGLAGALRSLDLLVASEHDIGEADGPAALVALRAWAGPGPQLVVTAGAGGAWLDGGSGPAIHVPAQVVEGRHTIGAGDAFSAVLTARRGAGDGLVDAALSAAAATAAYLASRPNPVAEGAPDPAGKPDMDLLEGTSWRAVRFGPGLAESPPADAEFSLDLAEGRVSGKSGCNRYMGGWTMLEGALTVGPFASTMMYCTEPLMRLEGVFLQAMQGVSDLGVNGDTLTLLGPSGDPLVELTRTPGGDETRA